MAEPKILISINASWNIFNFRQGLVAALRERGFRVLALAPRDEYSARLEALGVEYRPLEMDSKGISPLRDLGLLARYYRALKALRPDVYLGYTAKPNVYGSLAAHALGIPVINNVAGLGTAFMKRGPLRRILTYLYKLAFRRSATVFFQNGEDMAQFIGDGIARQDQARLLPGSGVDLARFSVGEERGQDEPHFRFLLMARLIWDKGLREYVEAARLVREEFPAARFQILGFLDVDNRTAVPRASLDAWVAAGEVEYLGQSDDVRPFIRDADCVVLPSYREGLPRALLEGAALAKPLIATDVPGCRQIVLEGENGFLCEVRSAQSLADAMLRMLRLDHAERRRLGTEGRRIVEQRFDERMVIESYVDAVARALGDRSIRGQVDRIRS